MNLALKIPWKHMAFPFESKKDFAFITTSCWVTLGHKRPSAWNIKQVFPCAKTGFLNKNRAGFSISGTWRKCSICWRHPQALWWHFSAFPSSHPPLFAACFHQVIFFSLSPMPPRLPPPPPSPRPVWCGGLWGGSVMENAPTASSPPTASSSQPLLEAPTGLPSE